MQILVALIILSLAVIILWFRAKHDSHHSEEDRLGLPAILLVLWVIASVVFGIHFFIVRLAGSFDITIERLIFIMILIFLGVGLLGGKVRLRLPVTIEIVMGIFILICLLSMMRTGFLPVSSKFISPWSVFISGYLFPFILFVFAKNYVFHGRDMAFLLKALFYFGIYLSVTAFFEYVELHQLVIPRFIRDPAVSEMHLERARGPFLNAAMNGFGIIVGFICGLHLLQQQKGLTKAFYLAALCLFIPAVYFTQTRSAYLGLFITLFIFLIWYRAPFPKWKIVSLPLVLVLMVGVAYSPRLLSADRREGGVAQKQEVDVRFALMEKSYALFSAQPITGVGLSQFIPSSYGSYKGTISFSMEEMEPQLQHNHILGIAAELGFPGLLAYLTLVGLILRRLMQLKARLPEGGVMGKNLCIAGFAIWCVFLETGLFAETSLDLFTSAVPYIFAGLADGLYTRSRESGMLPCASIRLSQPPMRIVSSHV
ncbi:MAG: O-antigen ligase family protein [Thermodesulfobacteriota bacterium]